MADYTFVDEPDRISTWLERQSRVGVDTEFMRERTYFSRLCLIQIASADDIYCVDPMAECDMSQFWDSFCARNWVLHSARQDIEVIYQTAEHMPASIFDTQIAAGLLGYQPQIGYGNLIQELFGVSLPKTHTRANWAARPLPDAYLEYAAEDVEYLLPTYEALAERLDKKGRLAWAESDSAALLDPSLYEIDPAAAVERLKGATRLRSRRRAAASRLAEWREAEAVRRNLPRQWILRDSVLIDIAMRAPSTLDELSKVADIPAKVARRAGAEILDAVARAARDEHDYEPPAVPDEARRTVLRQMQKIVAECAAGLGVAAETIASKKELSAILAGGHSDARVLSGWRRELVGDRLKALL